MNNGMTKRHSQMLYGIAILLMLYHHLFCIPEKLNCNYISIIGTMETRIAWFAKICVAVYAFISGYAACKYVKNKCNSMTSVKEIFGESCKYSIKRILFFLKKFSIVFVIFIPLGIALNYVTESFWDCMRGLISTKGCVNAEWWYARQYIFMLIVFPFMHLIIDRIIIFWRITKKKFLITCTIVFLAVGVFFLLGGWEYQKRYIEMRPFLIYSNTSIYLRVFFIGYLCARLDLFVIRNTSQHLWRRTIPAILSLVGCFAIRTFLTTEPGYSSVDVLLVVPFCLSICLLLREQGIVAKILQWLGKYSTYIWLTHTFFCYYYFQKFITISRVSIVMYVQLLCVSLVTAKMLDIIEQYLDKVIKYIGGGLCLKKKRG